MIAAGGEVIEPTLEPRDFQRRRCGLEVIQIWRKGIHVCGG